jgi:hypothetical protein
MSGLLILGYIFFLYSASSFNVDTTGTQYQTQSGFLNGLISNSGYIVSIMAIIFFISGVFAALEKVSDYRKGRRGLRL